MRPNLAAHHAAMFNLYIVFMLLLFFNLLPALIVAVMLWRTDSSRCLLGIICINRGMQNRRYVIASPFLVSVIMADSNWFNI